MLPAAYATYSIHVQGLFFIGLILGTVFAEVFFSGRLSDLLMVRLAKQNNGMHLVPCRLAFSQEARLVNLPKKLSRFWLLGRRLAS